MSITTNFPAIRPTLNLDFVNSLTVDPRITFTRASTATYYDGKTVAKAEENLLVRSQEFDNAAWVNVNATVTANTGAAPDGTTTADRLVPDTATNRHVIYQTVHGPTVGSPITFSFFAKADGYDFVQAALCRNSGAPTAWFIVNLTNGAVTELTQGNEFGTVSSFVRSVGNGWYRISITGSAVAAGTTSFQAVIAVSNAGTGVSYTASSPSFAGDGTSGILVWGAQLEQRSTVTAYTPTTNQPITRYVPQLMTAAVNTPRIDFDPVTGVCRGLLIEEQRTNLLTWSQEFDNAVWVKSRSSIAANVVVAPDGTLTADALIEDTSNGAHDLFQQNYNGTASTFYTKSVFLKAAGRSRVRLNMTDTATGGVIADFDLSSGTIAAAATVSAGNWASPSASITAVGNGWFRVAVSGQKTAGANNTIQFTVQLMSGANNSYTGDGFSGIYIWGAQLEAGAFPTSYIPTTSSQVTRSDDGAAMTGTNFSSWYRQDEGTLYGEVSITWAGGNDRVFAALNNGTSQNTFELYANASNDFVLYMASGNAVQATTYVTSALAANTLMRAAGAFSVNNVRIAAGGTLSSLDSSALVPVVDRLSIGSRARALPWNGHVRKLVYWPKRITDTQLQALTA